MSDSDHDTCGDDHDEVEPRGSKVDHQEEVEADCDSNQRTKNEQGVVLPRSPVRLGA